MIRYLWLITSLSLCVYTKFAYSTLYSCEVFRDKQKITTLTGSLDSSLQTDPNTALTYTLCQQAGLNPINVMIAIPGIRTSAAVTKSQLLPNPACSLKCTPQYYP